MNMSFFAVRREYVIIAATGVIVGAILGGMMMTVSAATPALEEITIIAPHEVQRKEVGRSNLGAPVEVISITRRISYAGMDLTKPANVSDLEKVIKDTANDSCKEIENQYPEAMYPTVPASQNCAKTATNDAMKQLNAAVAAAHHR
jgi:UrcA family protein